MLTAIAVLCAYGACLAFFHASPRRTAVSQIKSSLALQRGVRALAWSLSVAALVLMVALMGFERGVPSGLGLLMLAGITSLLVSALRPERHVKSLYAVAALCGLFGTAALIG
ncbi:MAG: DUF3325 family protein [Litorimonas sp.]